MTKEEKTSLYSIIEKDELGILDSFIKGNFTNPDVINLKLSIKFKC